MSSFKPGDRISLINGEVVTVAECIGNGANAEVYRAEKENGEAVALKYLFGPYSTNNRIYYQKCHLLSHINPPHPGIVWFHDSAITPYDEESETFAYTMPLLDGWTPLKWPIIKSDELTVAEKINVAMQLAEAFQSLHSVGFIYGDVSAENILYKRDSNGTISVKLIDCDNVSMPGRSLGLSGTGLYRAPEVILGAAPTKASDVHALSVLVFRLFVCVHPLDTDTVHEHCFEPDVIEKYFGETPHSFLYRNSSGAIEARSSYMSRRLFQLIPEKLQQYFYLIFDDNCLLHPGNRPSIDGFTNILKSLNTL